MRVIELANIKCLRSATSISKLLPTYIRNVYRSVFIVHKLWGEVKMAELAKLQEEALVMFEIMDHSCIIFSEHNIIYNSVWMN